MSQRVTNSIDSHAFVKAKILKSIGKMQRPQRQITDTVVTLQNGRVDLVTKNTHVKYQSPSTYNSKG
jgi:hypothetical protein